jgi:hypothetical protein
MRSGLRNDRRTSGRDGAPRCRGRVQRRAELDACVPAHSSRPLDAGGNIAVRDHYGSMPARVNWRTKARLARVISKLPSGMSYRVYYFIQRHFGALRLAHPENHLKAGVVIADAIKKRKQDLTGAETFLEIGTGRRLTLPIALWLCGASQVITVDLNPYLKPELVFEDIAYLRDHREMVIRMFGPRTENRGFHERLELLLNFKGELNKLLSLLNIRYMASADAARLGIPDQSIDYHISFGVIEHIQRELLDGILVEARRVLKKAGLAVHYATLADPFSGDDDSISPVNFLRFSEEQWVSIAGNRYMYHNRLRVDELRELFERAGFRILDLDVQMHPESLRVLKTGTLPLDRRFRDKSPETNASQSVWLTAAPC